MIMEDKREQILTRCLEILTTVAANDPTATVKRNRGNMKQDARPAFVLLDGDETARLTGDRRGRVRMATQLMTMRPQFFVLLKDTKPQNENIGQDLNAYRVRLIEALASDTTLANLIGSNGDIALAGVETDLKSGSSVAGEMRLDFNITYVLDPS